MTDRTRAWLFVLIGVVCLGAAAGYMRYAAVRSVPLRSAIEAPSPGAAKITWTPAGQPHAPYLLFRSTLPDESFGHVGFVPLGGPTDARSLTPLSCHRLYFRGGRGICMIMEADLLYPNQAFVFDQQFKPGNRLKLTGPPSRTRVSSDGRLAAVTVFESGHSYADEGFSTRTSFIDTTSQRILFDLEQFAVTRDGKPFKAVDFNFWGVTFMPDNHRFYATLRTGGSIYLVQGDVETRTASVIHPDIECPSLSPDGKHIAFKKRVSGSFGIGWQAAIFDVATKEEKVLDIEQRSIDDQIDWLDNDHIVYHHPSSRGADIWTLRTNNAEAPRILLSDAYSPSIVLE
jgi:hypothetical protein